MGERTERILFWVVIAAAALPRIWLAITNHGVMWADEIHQSVEPGHRAAFGYGLTAWEFRDGTRSWIFPGALAAVMRVASFLGVDSGLGIAAAARVFMASLSVLAIGATMRLARRLAGPAAGLAAGAILAALPPYLFVSHRALSETASAPLCVLVPLLLLGNSRARWAAAGALAVIACLIRIQNAAVLVPILAWFARDWRLALRALVPGIAAAAAFGAILDTLTWGSPFHSTFANLEFNLDKRGASSFGVETRGYYLAVLRTSIGPAALVLAAAALVGVRRSWWLLASAVVFIYAHSRIEHKELRFLTPVLPHLAACAGIGVAVALARLPRASALVGVVVAPLVAMLALHAPGLGRHDLGQRKEHDRPGWPLGHDVNVVLGRVGERGDVCGVAVLGQPMARVGGYTYLHRDVPLVFRIRALCDAVDAANYVIASRTARPPGYEQILVVGEIAAFRRDGACAPPHPSDDRMLPGAHELGLHRRQRECSGGPALALDAAAQCRNPTTGWRKSDWTGCRRTRAAPGGSAQIEFTLEPEPARYVLAFSARTSKQPARSIAVELNGDRADHELTTAWRGEHRLLPDGAVQAGGNRLRFEARDDDKKMDLVVEHVAIAPVTASHRLDVGTSAARPFLSGGWGDDERDGGRTGARARSGSRAALYVAGGAAAYRLQLAARARSGVVSVRAKLGGAVIGEVEVGEAWADHALVIGGDLVAPGPNELELQWIAGAVIVDEIAMEPAATAPR
jgi:GPI mannosyltransferase 3